MDEAEGELDTGEKSARGQWREGSEGSEGKEGRDEQPKDEEAEHVLRGDAGGGGESVRECLRE